MQMPDWAGEFRSLMPVTERWAYFDHAAVAPLPAPARERVRQWLDDMAENGDANWFQWRDQVEQTRDLFARLLHADRGEIALVHNTTEGINLVAEGYPWQPGDNVVTLASEFPSNLYPWQNLLSRGVETRLVRCEREQPDWSHLEQLCDERTRILSVSWVGYVTGWRNDLRQFSDFAREREILLFVDAIQGLGVLPLDLRDIPIDFLAADGHKWLLGPEAGGVLFVRQQHLETLRPLLIGWNSVRQAGNFSDHTLQLKPTADRYEGGSYSMGNIAALGASLELFDRFTIPAIAGQLQAITAELITQLEALGASIHSAREAHRRSGIVSFTLPDVPPLTVKTRCLEAGVLLNVRGNAVRLSPHAYCSAEDIQRLTDTLRGM